MRFVKSLFITFAVISFMGLISCKETVEPSEQTIAELAKDTEDLSLLV